jgi:hypothetical protein
LGAGFVPKTDQCFFVHLSFLSEKPSNPFGIGERLREG